MPRSTSPETRLPKAWRVTLASLTLASCAEIPDIPNIVPLAKPTAEVAKDVQNNAEKAADEIGKVIKLYCKTTFDAYKDGEIQPHTSGGDKSRKVLSLAVGPSGLLETEFDSEDAKLTEKECTDNVAGYWFDHWEQRDLVADGRRDRANFQGAAYIDISGSTKRGETKWVIVAENGVNMKDVPEWDSELSFTVPEDPAMKGEDTLNDAQYFVVHAVTEFAERIARL